MTPFYVWMQTKTFDLISLNLLSRRTYLLSSIVVLSLLVSTLNVAYVCVVCVDDCVMCVSALELRSSRAADTRTDDTYPESVDGRPDAANRMGFGLVVIILLHRSVLRSFIDLPLWRAPPGRVKLSSVPGRSGP